MENEQPDSPPGRYRRKRPDRERKRKAPIIIPLVFLLGFIGVIAWNEAPSVRDWFDKTYRPEHWKIRHACEQAGLDGAAHPAMARLLKPGRVNKTREGYFVDKVLVGEMGDDGAEQKIRVTCYLDVNGQLIKSHREPSFSKPSVPDDV